MYEKTPPPLKINFIYLNNKKFTAVFKKSCKISFSTKCHYFIILYFSILTNHALKFKYQPWGDKGFNVVFKLTPPWSPQAEDTRAPVCTVYAAKVQSPRKPQCSQSVEAGMWDAGMNAGRLLPVTLFPENIWNLLLCSEIKWHQGC